MAGGAMLGLLYYAVDNVESFVEVFIYVYSLLILVRNIVEGVRAVVTSLIQAEKYGTPLGQALRVMAQENRDIRMSEAEKRAAALPPKRTVQMIIFFLPVLFAVIIAPAAIQIMNM